MRLESSTASSDSFSIHQPITNPPPPAEHHRPNRRNGYKRRTLLPAAALPHPHGLRILRILNGRRPLHPSTQRFAETRSATQTCKFRRPKTNILTIRRGADRQIPHQILQNAQIRTAAATNTTLKTLRQHEFRPPVAAKQGESRNYPPPDPPGLLYGIKTARSHSRPG